MATYRQESEIWDQVLYILKTLQQDAELLNIFQQHINEPTFDWTTVNIAKKEIGYSVRANKDIYTISNLFAKRSEEDEEQDDWEGKKFENTNYFQKFLRIFLEIIELNNRGVKLPKEDVEYIKSPVSGDKLILHFLLMRMLIEWIDRYIDGPPRELITYLRRRKVFILKVYYKKIHNLKIKNSIQDQIDDIADVLQKTASTIKSDWYWWERQKDDIESFLKDQCRIYKIATEDFDDFCTFLDF